MSAQLGFIGKEWSDADLPPILKRTFSRRKKHENEHEQYELSLTFPSEEEFLAMSDDEVLAMRECFMARALRAIVDGRVSKTERKKWLEWVSSDEIHPFSFVVISYELQVDPEVLRDVFEYFVKRHHKEYLDEVESSIHH